MCEERGIDKKEKDDNVKGEGEGFCEMKCCDV